MKNINYKTKLRSVFLFIKDQMWNNEDQIVKVLFGQTVIQSNPTHRGFSGEIKGRMCWCGAVGDFSLKQKKDCEGCIVALWLALK